MSVALATITPEGGGRCGGGGGVGDLGLAGARALHDTDTRGCGGTEGSMATASASEGEVYAWHGSTYDDAFSWSKNLFSEQGAARTYALFFFFFAQTFQLNRTLP